MKPEIAFPSQPATKTLRITVHTSKEQEGYGREILFLIVGIFISFKKLKQLRCDHSLVSCASNHKTKKFTSKPPSGLIGVFIRNRLKFMFILCKLLEQAIYCTYQLF